jgi:protein-disulfide isomerase
VPLRVRDRLAEALSFAAILILAVVVARDQFRLTELEGRLSRFEAGTTDRRSPVIQISGAAAKGSRDARAALVVYSDFQCPYCSAFARSTLMEIERRYVATGRLVVVFKHFPLERLHDQAIRAAEAAACANRQDRFWPMHDRLFSGPNLPDGVSLLAWANDVGLDRSQFASCFETHTELPQIQRDADEARRLGFTGTPAFVLGPLAASSVTVARRVKGSRPLEDFIFAIDEILRGLN